MIEGIHKRVDEAAGQFRENTGIEISEPTRAMIAAVISAILEDPHPNWRLPSGDDRSRQLDGIITAYLSAVPLFFHQIVVSERVRDKITVFDFLHWFSKSFEPMMCVIPK